jgi:hypothetical protein
MHAGTRAGTGTAWLLKRRQCGFALWRRAVLHSSRRRKVALGRNVWFCIRAGGLASLWGDVPPPFEQGGLTSLWGDVPSCIRAGGLLSCWGDVPSCIRAGGLMSRWGDVPSCIRAGGLLSCWGDVPSCVLHLRRRTDIALGDVPSCIRAGGLLSCWGDVPSCSGVQRRSACSTVAACRWRSLVRHPSELAHVALHHVGER